MGFIILLAGVMSQIPLLLYLAAASVSSYYLAPTRELKYVPRYIDGGPAPDYQILQIVPTELEDLQNINEPEIENLIYPADDFDLNQEPSYLDYLDPAPEYHQSQDFPFFGGSSSMDVENLRDLLKETDNQESELDQDSPSTAKITQETTTTTTTTTQPPHTQQGDRRRASGMLEVPILRPEEARDPKFIYRG